MGRSPACSRTLAGVNHSPRSNGHELGCAMKFTDQAAFDAYFAHPLHQALLKWLVPLVDATDVDFFIEPR